MAAIEKVTAQTKAVELCIQLRYCASVVKNQPDLTSPKDYEPLVEGLQSLRHVVCEAAAMTASPFRAYECSGLCGMKAEPDMDPTANDRPTAGRRRSGTRSYFFRRWLRVEMAWLLLHDVDERFVAIAPEPFVRPRMAEVLARARVALPKGDPRLEEMEDLYARCSTRARNGSEPNHGWRDRAGQALRVVRPGHADNRATGRDADDPDPGDNLPADGNPGADITLGDHDRRTMAAVLHAAYSNSDRGYVRAHTFRNMLLIATILLSVALGILLWVGSSSPGALSLCARKVSGDALAPPAAEPSGGTAAGSVSLTFICPTGEHSGPQGGDVLMVALLGAVGAGVSALAALAELRHLVDPYWTPVFQGLLKVPVGAITAILGVLAVEGGLEPSSGALNSQGSILVLAFVFGYSQKILTRLIDKRGSEVRERLVTEPDAHQQNPA